MLAICACFICDAKKVVDIYELTFDENVNSPAIVKDNIAQRVQDFQNKQAIDLINNNLEVELMRNGEVIIVTIPADELFAPNDTILMSKSKDTLSKLLKFTKTPGMYKMLLVMHSDNTGSEAYTNHLTTVRVSAVFDWIKDNAACSDYVIPYAMGADDPLPNTPNNSVDNREKNRRLEIYLVPGKSMIRKSSRGQLR